MADPVFDPAQALADYEATKQARDLPADALTVRQGQLENQIPGQGLPPAAAEVVGDITARRAGQRQPDPIDASIERFAKKLDAANLRQAQLLDWKTKSDKLTPEQRSDVLRYSAATGLNPAFVEKNLDEVRKRADANGVDWHDVVNRNPALTTWLSKNPEFTTVVRDDVSRLRGLEWLITAWPTALADAVMEQGLVARQFVEAFGMGDEENRAAIREMESRYASRDYGASSFMEKAFIGSARMLPYLVGEATARVAGAAIGGALGAPAGAGAGAAAAAAPTAGAGAPAGATVGGAAGLIGGATVGQFFGSFLWNSYQSIGPLHWRLSQLRDSNGQPVDPMLVDALAQATALGTGALFSLSMGKLVSSLPGMKGLIDKVGGSVVQRALSPGPSSAGAAMLAMGKRYSGTVLLGASAIAIQGGVNQVAEEAAKGLSGGDFQAKWSNVGTAVAESFEQGIEDTALLAAIGPGAALLRDVGVARKSAQSQARLEFLRNPENVNSEFFRKHPEEARDLIREMKKQGKAGVDNALVPIDQWNAYWQAQGVDPGQAAMHVIGDDGAAFQRAMDAKGDLAIPIEQYMTKMVTTQHAEGLKLDTRLDYEEYTIREVVLHQKEISEKMKAEAERRAPELQEASKELGEKYAAAAKQAGATEENAQAVSQLLVEYAKQWALRLDLPMDEAANFALGQLTIVGSNAKAVRTAIKSVVRKSAPATDGTTGDVVEQKQVRITKNGFLRFRVKDGHAMQFEINLLSTANKTTLAHETGHFLSWGLHEMSLHEKATPEVKADYDVLLRFAGYTDGKHRVTETAERVRLQQKVKEGKATNAERERVDALEAKEEKIARAWEQYLGEGKAPSKALKAVFDRFVEWMREVYGNLDGIRTAYRKMFNQELRLSDDVRGVFDRLIATDDAIAEARGMLREDTAASALMTPAQQNAYREALASAVLHVDDEVRHEAAQIEAGRMGEAAAEIRAEVMTELDREPAYRAQRYLSDGEYADGTGEVLSGDKLPPHLKPHAKLNRKEFVKLFGAEEARNLPEAAALFDPRDGMGMKPEVAARSLGFADAADMLAEFKQHGSRYERQEKLVQQKLDERYGPALNALREAAMNAAHTDAAAVASLMELRALQRDVDPSSAGRVRSIRNPKAHYQFLREHAARVLDEDQVQNIDPRRYLYNGARAEKAYAKLWSQGKKAEAIDQKEAAVFNRVLYNEARKLKTQLSVARKQMAISKSERGYLGRADPSYRDLHDALRAQADGHVTTVGPLDQALIRARTDKADVGFDPDLLRSTMAKGRPWEQLAAGEALNLAEAAKNILAWARITTGITVDGQRRELDAVMRASEELWMQNPGAPPPQAFERASRATHPVRAFMATIDDMRTVANMLDRGDRNGFWHKMLVDEQVRSHSKALELAEMVADPIHKAWHDMPRDVRKLRDQMVPQLADLLPVPDEFKRYFLAPQERSTLWMVFLASGDADGKRWLTEGYGWTEENVQRALDLLTDEEAVFLQGVLDTMSLLRGDLGAVHMRRTGLPMKLAQASPIVIRGKKYAGGYFPNRPNRDFIDATPGGREITSMADVQQPNYESAIRPTVAAPHRIERRPGSVRPIDLNWQVVPQHLSQAIHDIAYGDYVRDMGNIFLHRDFKKLVTHYFGKEYADEFLPWLADVANQRADSSAGHVSSFLQQVGQWGRRGLAMSILGFNLPNQLQGLTDAFRAPIIGIPLWRIGQNYVRMMRPGAWTDFKPFAEMSQLKRRSSIVLENLQRVMLEIDPTQERSRVIELLERVAFYGYQMTDAFTTRVVARSAYENAVSKGLTHAEAVRAGDDAIATLYTTHDVAERPPLLRTKHGLASMLVFHTWANKNYNMLRRMAPPGMSKVQAVPYIAARLMFYGLIGAGSAYFIGRGPEEDEDPRAWLLRRMAFEPLSVLPFVAWPAEALVKGDQVNMRSAPDVAFAEDVLNKIGRQLQKVRKGDATAAEKALLIAEGITGAAALRTGGVPFGQIDRTLRYVQETYDRDIRPRGPLDVAQGFLAGPPRKGNPGSPLTDLQDVLAEND